MGTFPHYTNLTYDCKDSKGQYPEKKWIDKEFFHPKTRRVYQVQGFVWNSSTDEWNVYYSRRGCIVNFTKIIAEFKEKFIEIEGPTEPKEEDE